MLAKVLETPVDDLVEIVKNNDNITIAQLSEKLNNPIELVEKWLVVLEEFQILTVQYKGIEGYVRFTENGVKKDSKDELDISKLKGEYVEKGKRKNLSYDRMKELWPDFIQKYEGEIKELFDKKAKELGYEKNQVDKAWERYKLELNTL